MLNATDKVKDASTGNSKKWLLETTWLPAWDFCSRSNWQEAGSPCWKPSTAPCSS